MASGGRASVALSEPLHGGSPEGRGAGPKELQERSEGSSTPKVNHWKVPPHDFSEDHTDPATGLNSFPSRSETVLIQTH